MPPFAERFSDAALDSEDSGVVPHAGVRDARRSKGRLLLADDEPALLRGMIRLLRSQGYSVTAVSCAEDAQAQFKLQTFDAVVTDISMPGGSGIELLHALHTINPDVPVVLVTGEPTVSTAVKALEYGAFHYLTKPVEVNMLLEVVEKATCLHRMATMRRRSQEYLTPHSVRNDLANLRGNFDRALESLWLAFQPIVHSSSNGIFGYEALLRTNEKSLPHPGAVLDAAEKLGELDTLGRLIRARAAEAMVGAPPGAALFVNIHTTDLTDPELLSPDAPLSKIASRVVLEITERSSIDQVPDVRGLIGQLRKIGYRIAVDDLGAGYAGLTSFAMLEPEIVKLDMSLIRDVHESPTRQKLIQSMTTLCKDMGMLVVGEGVETAEERRCLEGLNCDLLQGYLIARPGKPFPGVQQ